jgi:hypothetical protein
MSHRLLGWDELMPPRDTGGNETRRSTKLCGYWGEQLRGIFTSDQMRNQLVSFGEFAVMYLMAYSPAVWPNSWPDFGSICNGVSQGDWYGQITNVDGFKRALPAVQRALANIPTYFIFDDHDVTDDWNLYEKFVTRVDKSPLARRVVANALAAYWLFQAWGDDPDYFQNLARPVSDSLASASRGGGTFEDVLLKHPSWAFIAPTVPQVVCIDSRTQRGFDPQPGVQRGESTMPPRLMGKDEVTRFGQLCAKALQSNPRSALIVVAATPVFGVEVFEGLQRLAAKLGLRPETFDFESWRARSAGFVDFIGAVAAVRPKSCIILSGDVHYGFATKVGLISREQGAATVCLQYTSSALRNWIGKKLFVVARWANYPTQHLDIWRRPATSTRTQTGPLEGESEDAEGILKILSSAPIIVDSGFARRVDVIEPFDFRLSLELQAPVDAYGKPMVLRENNLGQLVTDGRTAMLYFHAAERKGGTKDSPRVVSVDLTTLPRMPAIPNQLRRSIEPWTPF